MHTANAKDCHLAWRRREKREEAGGKQTIKFQDQLSLTIAHCPLTLVPSSALLRCQVIRLLRMGLARFFSCGLSRRMSSVQTAWYGPASSLEDSSTACSMRRLRSNPLP